MRSTELIHTFHPTDLEVLAESHAEEFHKARDLAERSARRHVAAWLRHVAGNIEKFEIFDCDVSEMLPPGSTSWTGGGISFSFTPSTKA